jgi:hypothetical protein
MTLLGGLSLSAIGKIIAAIWANGSRFLCSVAVAFAAAALVIRIGAYLGLAKAQPLWDEYGLLILLLAVVTSVFAIFKMRAERRNTGLSLIADEQNSFWHHARQQDGSVLTQFALRFHATNMNEGGSIHLSKVRMNWPWVRRHRMVDARLTTQHATDNVYSADFGIQPRKRRACAAHIFVRGAVGGVGRKKPMRVTIGVQDHAGRWHKLTFRGLRDPQISR